MFLSALRTGAAGEKGIRNGDCRPGVSGAVTLPGMASECQTDSLCRQAGELTGDGDPSARELHSPALLFKLVSERESHSGVQEFIGELEKSGITVDAGIESIISNDIFTGVGTRFVR